MDDQEHEDQMKFGGIISLAFGAWLVFFIIGIVLCTRGVITDAASFGDYFGILNALFSSGAVAGAVYAVILQQKELKLAREQQQQAIEAHKDNAQSQKKILLIQMHAELIKYYQDEIELESKAISLAKEVIRNAESYRTEHNLYDYQSREEALEFMRQQIDVGWKCTLPIGEPREIVPQLKSLLKEFTDEVGAKVEQQSKEISKIFDDLTKSREILINLKENI